MKLATLAVNVAAVAALTLAPVIASAQPENAPSYGSGEDSVTGRIVSFDGEYNLDVRDSHGYVDHIRLHQGTIINPVGLKLATGMSVTVLGVNRGSTLAANEIDTPYHEEYPQYVAAYPAYAVPYAYGYPYGYGYGYGPTIGLGFGFGGRGYYGRGFYGGGYGRGFYGRR